MTEKGTLFIVASGNEGPSFGTINFPGELLEVLTIGAAGCNGKYKSMNID